MHHAPFVARVAVYFHPEEGESIWRLWPSRGGAVLFVSRAAELRCEQGVGYERAGDEEQERATASGKRGVGGQGRACVDNARGGAVAEPARRGPVIVLAERLQEPGTEKQVPYAHASGEQLRSG